MYWKLYSNEVLTAGSEEEIFIDAHLETAIETGLDFIL